MTCLCASAATAAPAMDGDLLVGIDYFQEDAGSPLTLPQAQARFAAGMATRADQPYLTFGIGKRSAWVRLTLESPHAAHQHRRLTAGQTWLNRVDVYRVSALGGISHWRGGDGQPADAHLLPGIGLVFDMTIAPGASEVFIRAESDDPLTLPIRLDAEDESRQQDIRVSLGSGILYGILLALVVFNLVFYTILRQPYSLYYSLYIGCFMVMNAGYSGYAFAWLYPDWPGFQNYSTLCVMVLHGVCGLLFVSSFLGLRQRLPRFNRLLMLYALGGLLAIGYEVAAQKHLAASLIAFGFLALTTPLMILIGLCNLRRGREVLYFTLALGCSMFGLFTTTLAVWGIVPFTPLRFHAAEIGVLCEALLLAGVVALRLKSIDRERISAQYLATRDPLTQLLNRRAFRDRAGKLLEAGERSGQPLSFLILDIDHFKAINDTFGHPVGDRVLVHLAELLRRHQRRADLVARWGGEEMVMLLPDTGLAQAVVRAEQLRASLKSSALIVEGKQLVVTASFGVASRRRGESLEGLLKRADERLYLAKQLGRDQVEPAPHRNQSD